MDLIIDYILPFLLVLSVLVFVHEWGHYWVARRCGVRVEVFSIGFGPKLFGFTDKAQTQWKVSAIPLGGYVKFFGDSDPSSARPSQQREPGNSGLNVSGDVVEPTRLTLQEQAVSFHYKPLWQRSLIVAAGPAANFLLAIVILAGLLMFTGHPFPPPVVGEVQRGSAAEAVGLRAGDRIVAVEGERIYRFAEIALHVQRAEDEPLEMTVARDGERFSVEARPEPVTVEDRSGEPVTIYRLGIAADTARQGPVEAVGSAVAETAELTWMTLAALGEIIAGDRGTEELGGPIRIAQMSGDVAQLGLLALFWFMAILSINLGLINLFPIPMLDGGHLLFYAAEAVRGRPLGERAQEYGFRIGLALVLSLMIFVTWNDLVQLRVIAFIKDVIS